MTIERVAWIRFVTRGLCSQKVENSGVTGFIVVNSRRT
jgi:hypothetical protein